ncbi:hypothetical protein [Sinorhizobium meliloti]|nr:hypothetical protein [Sinorhizobium meliloti]MDE4591161.1 hypothetical protein [Sinorhizobium meliloti]
MNTEQAKKRGIEILEGLLGHNNEQPGEASTEKGRIRPPRGTDKKEDPA